MLSNLNEDSDIEGWVSLERYRILDSIPSDKFEKLSHTAALSLKVPVVVINFMDSEKTWVKWTESGENHAGNWSITDYMLPRFSELTIIDKAQTNPVTKTNEFIGKNQFNFFASVPIELYGKKNVGALSVFSVDRKSFSEEDRAIFISLGQLISDYLETRMEVFRTTSRQDQMMSMVAHELKNVLSQIPLYTDILSQDIGEDPNLLQITRHIDRAANKMKLLINEMLEVTRMQSRQLTLKKSQVELASIVARIVAGNRVLANAKHQQLLIDVTQTVKILADTDRLGEALDNLVNNAIKYSPPGSEVCVALKIVNDRALITVSDEGPGLSDEDMMQLFQPFTKLSAKPTGGEVSTGVGLSIVRFLIDGHGGSVFAANREDKKGALFTIELPV